MEEENQNKYDEGIRYFIEPNKVYELVRNDYNDRIFYKIKCKTTNAKKEEIECFKNVSFRGDVIFENGALIKIKSGFESFYFRRGDKFNPVFTLVITDWEVVNQENIDNSNTSNEYNLSGDEDLDIF